MRIVVQRVTKAYVTVESAVVGEIGVGLLALVAITHDDTVEDAATMAAKLAGLRVFGDGDVPMNRSTLDVEGAVLAVSQFTLYGNLRKGRRPSFIDAAPGDVAEPLFEEFVARLVGEGLEVATGRFGAEMTVGLVNDGPCTLLLETINGRML